MQSLNQLSAVIMAVANLIALCMVAASETTARLITEPRTPKQRAFYIVKSVMKTNEPITLNDLALSVINRTGLTIPTGATPVRALSQNFNAISMLLEQVAEGVTEASAAALTKMVAAYAANNNDTAEAAFITIDTAVKLAKLIADIRLYACEIPTYSNVCDAMAAFDECV